MRRMWEWARAGWLAGLCLLGTGQAVAQDAVQDAVQDARRAMEAKQWDAVLAQVPKAEGSLLQAYPEYWWLRQQLAEQRRGGLPMPAIERFLRLHGDQYVTERLRQDAILAGARLGDFPAVRKLAEDVAAPSPQMRCAIAHAEAVRPRAGLPDNLNTLFTPGQSCWALYDYLVERDLVPWATRADLMRGFIERNELPHAKRAARYLWDAEQRKTFEALLDNPERWLNRQTAAPATREARELAVVALARLARKDMEPGYATFQRTWAKRLPAEDVTWVQGHFALLAALRMHPSAVAWYRPTAGTELTDYNGAWRVRSALRETDIDWPWVLQSIAMLPETQREEPAWRYWRGRALAAQGEEAAARAEFSLVAPQWNYYGQLAAEELGLLTTIPSLPAALTAAELASMQANPGLQRSLALFGLGWRAEAVGEWNAAIRGLDDRQLRAAAQLAHEAGIYDRVVNTAERTREEHDFSQRFLAPYQGRVTAKAQEIGLDPAWVYGLIRQESRFVPSARSGVGASGLMQLMPATATWVARRIGMTDFRPAQVNDFDVNTTLGTNYLNIVLQDLDGSQLLASAGYNAGPGRPRTWRATFARPVEGAIFAETIPFTETRDYVQKVLSNATYYTALFTGEPQSLKARLGTVFPQAAVASSIP